MAYGKIDLFIDAMIREAYDRVYADRLLPLQQKVDRLRKDVDDLKRERGPPHQVSDQTETGN